MKFVNFTKKGLKPESYVYIVGDENDADYVSEKYYVEPDLSMIALHYLRGKYVDDYREELEDLMEIEINDDFLYFIKDWIPSGQYGRCHTVDSIEFYIDGIEHDPEYTDEDLAKALVKEFNENYKD